MGCGAYNLYRYEYFKMKPPNITEKDLVEAKEQMYYSIIMFTEEWLNPKEYYRKIKFFIQRGIRGWAECDAWDWYSYNAKVNCEVLKWLKEHKHGHPVAMFEYTEQRNPSDMEERIARDKWKEIINKMIFAFEQIKYDSYDGNLIKWYEGRDDADYKSFIKKYSETKLQTKEEYDLVQEGLQLYIKYYESLWD